MSGGVFSHDESSVDPASVMWKPFCGPSSRLVRFDESVALEALQRRVHLPDVERPHLAGARLELLLQLEAVLRAFAQQGEDCVANTHRDTRSLIIRSMVRSSVKYRSERKSNTSKPG
jgi:hypothetical protein